MEKIWYIKNRWDIGGKVYRSEKEFLSAVRGEKDERQVFVYTLAETGKAGELKTSIISSRDRNDHLRCILGEADKYEEAISGLRTLHSLLAKDSPEKRHIEERMSIIGLNKKEFSRMATSLKIYFLFGVSDSVEWYLALLKCHNFATIPNTYYKRAKGTAARVPTDPKMLENFRLAKESLKKKK